MKFLGVVLILVLVGAASVLTSKWLRERTNGELARWYALRPVPR